MKTTPPESVPEWNIQKEVDALRLGITIRNLRWRRNLTLQCESNLSGLSKPLLSQIEDEEIMLYQHMGDELICLQEGRLEFHGAGRIIHRSTAGRQPFFIRDDSPCGPTSEP